MANDFARGLEQDLSHRGWAYPCCGNNCEVHSHPQSPVGSGGELLLLRPVSCHRCVHRHCGPVFVPRRNLLRERRGSKKPSQRVCRRKPDQRRATWFGNVCPRNPTEVPNGTRAPEEHCNTKSAATSACDETTAVSAAPRKAPIPTTT
jgi:hypothetical protein